MRVEQMRVTDKVAIKNREIQELQGTPDRNTWDEYFIWDADFRK